ncbi:hypothetical protein Acor_55850 [Acrocarpospora corrugata]|uniref:Uncharacterized protein n=1 Tax=Acrocarpospora corrugata TaxID=35763 RepID=A0A5M3W5E2_9ACTN|nr:hypothetical protein Acor_55850 [Acrocarpospora corrugata]
MKWLGVGILVVAVVGMALYLTQVDLAEADQWASVLSAFLGLVGLALTCYGTIVSRTSREQAQTPGAAEPEQRDGVHNEISGGTFHGPVIQGREFGQVRHDLGGDV